MVDLSSYKDAGGTAWKWGDLGAILAGRIEYVSKPEPGTSFTGEPIEQISLTIEDDSGDMWRLWPKIRPLSNLGRSILDASGHNPEAGGTIKIQHVENRDTGKPQPMRVFAVVYTPPEAGSPDLTNDVF